MLSKLTQCVCWTCFLIIAVTATYSTATTTSSSSSQSTKSTTKPPTRLQATRRRPTTTTTTRSVLSTTVSPTKLHQITPSAFSSTEHVRTRQRPSKPTTRPTAKSSPIPKSTSTTASSTTTTTTTLSPQDVMERLYSMHGSGSSSLDKIYSQHGGSSMGNIYAQHGGGSHNSESSVMDKIYSLHSSGSSSANKHSSQASSSAMDHIYAQHGGSPSMDKIYQQHAMAAATIRRTTKKPDTSSSEEDEEDDTYKKHMSSSSSSSGSPSNKQYSMEKIYQQHSALPSSMYSIMAQHSSRPSKTKSPEKSSSSSSSSSVSSLMPSLLKQLTPVGAGISVILAPLLLLNGFFTFFSQVSRFLNNFSQVVNPVRPPPGPNPAMEPFPPAYLRRQPRLMNNPTARSNSDEMALLWENVVKALEKYEK